MRNRLPAVLLMLLGALLGLVALKPQSTHVVTPNGMTPPSGYLAGAIAGHLIMGALSIASFLYAQRLSRRANADRPANQIR